MKKWDIVIPTFPLRSVSNFLKIHNEKLSQKSYYSKHYAKLSRAIDEKEGMSNKLREPPESCENLKRKIIKRYKDNFKSKLEASDRMFVEPT